MSLASWSRLSALRWPSQRSKAFRCLSAGPRARAAAATTGIPHLDPKAVPQPPFALPQGGAGTGTLTKRPPREFKAQKAAITLTPRALDRLRALIDQPEPKLIRVGVRNKGCAGMSYHLEYVDKPGKFDEVVMQDGVRVLIDSKALFSIIGSEMDWVEDRLSARFSFNNPQIVASCGCGESFTVA